MAVNLDPKLYLGLMDIGYLGVAETTIDAYWESCGAHPKHMKLIEQLRPEHFTNLPSEMFSSLQNNTDLDTNEKLEHAAEKTYVQLEEFLKQTSQIWDEAILNDPALLILQLDIGDYDERASLRTPEGASQSSHPLANFLRLVTQSPLGFDSIMQPFLLKHRRNTELLSEITAFEIYVYDKWDLWPYNGDVNMYLEDAPKILQELFSNWLGELEAVMLGAQISSPTILDDLYVAGARAFPDLKFEPQYMQAAAVPLTLRWRNHPNQL